MGLFESQKTRNKRIFDEAFNEISSAIYQAVDKDLDRFYTHSSWVSGASILAQSVVERVNSLKHAWGKGGKEKALTLTEVCVQPMISIYFRSIEKQLEHPDDAKLEYLKEGKKGAMSNILNILGTMSEEKIMDFLNLDTQYKYEEDFRELREKTREEGVSLWYASLLMSKLRKAVGFSEYVNWDKQTFPVKQESDFSFVDENKPYGDLGFDFDGEVAIKMLIPIAGVEMFRYLRVMSGV
jgi:hypothetical protein